MPESGDTFRIDIRDYSGGEGGEKEKKVTRISALGVIETLLCRVIKSF